MFKTLTALLAAAAAMPAHAIGIDQDSVHVTFTQTGFGTTSLDLGSATISAIPSTFDTGLSMTISITSSELTFSVTSALSLIGSIASFSVEKTTGGIFAQPLQLQSDELGLYSYSTTGNTFVASITALHPAGSATFSIPSDVAPVPEPESYAMMLAGLGTMGAVVRRGRRVRRPSA